MARIYPSEKPTSAGQTVVYQGRNFVAKMVNPKGKQSSYLRWYLADAKKSKGEGRTRKPGTGGRRTRKAPEAPASDYLEGTVDGDYVVGTYNKKSGGKGNRWYHISTYRKRLAAGKEVPHPNANTIWTVPRSATAPTSNHVGGRGASGAKPIGDANDYQRDQVVEGTNGSRWKVIKKRSGGGGNGWKRVKNS